MRDSEADKGKAGKTGGNTSAINGPPQMPSMMPSAPPKAAPWEMPRISGETSGFRKTP